MGKEKITVNLKKLEEVENKFFNISNDIKDKKVNVEFSTNKGNVTDTMSVMIDELNGLGESLSNFFRSMANTVKESRITYEKMDLEMSKQYE